MRRILRNAHERILKNDFSTIADRRDFLPATPARCGDAEPRPARAVRADTLNRSGRARRAAGLRAWRPLLAGGGRVVFSEVIWIKRSVPEEARLFWMDYPQMTNRDGVRARVAAAGFRVVDDFVQPLSDWQTYLGPLGTRAEALRPEADETLRGVLDGARAEGDLFARHSDAYAYAVFVVEPA